jgi:hypothetical protein
MYMHAHPHTLHTLASRCAHRHTHSLRLFPDRHSLLLHGRGCLARSLVTEGYIKTWYLYLSSVLKHIAVRPRWIVNR